MAASAAERSVARCCSPCFFGRWRTGAAQLPRTAHARSGVTARLSLEQDSGVRILVALLLWCVIFGLMLKDTNNLSSRLDWLLWLAQIFGALAFFGGVALMLWNLKTVWRRRAALAGQGVERRAQRLGARRAVGGVRVQADQFRNPLLMSALRLSVAVEKLPFAAPFRIAGYVFEHRTPSSSRSRTARCAGAVRPRASSISTTTPRTWSPRSRPAGRRSRRASTAARCKGCCRRGRAQRARLRPVGAGRAPQRPSGVGARRA